MAKHKKYRKAYPRSWLNKVNVTARTDNFINAQMKTASVNVELEEGNDKQVDYSSVKLIKAASKCSKTCPNMPIS